MADNPTDEVPYYHKGIMLLVTILILVQSIVISIVYSKFNLIEDPAIKQGNAISISRGWTIAMWVLFVISLVLTILVLTMIQQRGQLVVLVYLVILFILNLVFLGFLFYMQSQVLSSSDYVKAISGSCTDTICSNAISLKDSIITLLVFTGFMSIVLVIFFIVFYFKFKGAARGIGFGEVFSRLAQGGSGAEISEKNWFKDDDNRFSGKTCNKWYQQFEKHFSEYVKFRQLIQDNPKISTTAGKQILDDVVKDLIKNSGATSNPTA